MDYKVKYEAAMDSAIRRWEAGLMTKEEVIQIFPDAFESEDEKTRKQIIELVKNHSVNSDRCKMEDWLYRAKIKDN